MSDPIPDAHVAQKPVDYLPVDYAPTRPTSVTVLSILSIVFSLLGVICIPIGLLSYFVPAMQQGNPGIAAVKNDPPLFAYVLGTNMFSFVLSLILMIGAIASLKLIRWARPLMIGQSVVSIVSGLIITVGNLIWLTPKMVEATDPQFQNMVKYSSYIGGLIGLVFILAMPVLILYFFTRSHVVDAFERRMRI